MRRFSKGPIISSNGIAVSLSVLAALAALTVSGRSSRAGDEFKELLNQIPRAANAVVLLNMEKAKNSPLGLKENWQAKVERAFDAGLVRVPPQATRCVLASQMDFESMEPLWNAAIFELDEDFSMEEVAGIRQGTPDKIDNLPALARPNDTYLVKLGHRTLGAMQPANRQEVVRWIREVRKASPLPLSPYLQQAAGFSDKAGSEIIMAIDLDGAFCSNRVAKYLKSKQKQLDEWGANPLNLTKLLSDVQGIRVGVRIGEEPSAMIVIDVQGDASQVSSFAKPLLLQILSDKSAMIDDFQSWTAKAEGHEISLAGKLSKSGLRRLLSVVDSPASESPAAPPAAPAPAAQTPQESPGDLPTLQMNASLKYFRAIKAMAADLRSDMRDSKSLGSTGLWCDRYARRIERLPILNVDDELLKYSAFVAHQLRQARLAIRTMGIQSGARQAQIWGSDGGYGDDHQAKESERRGVRAEEKATMATNVYQIRDTIITATSDVRRKMTQKYQVEF